MSQYTFFYSNKSPFSQWYKTTFIIDGIEFNCCEQYMMYAKATLFKDPEHAAKILATSDPGKQKAFGRMVKDFNADKWNVTREQIVYTGNHAKFTQNENLKKHLLSTAGTILVEASPRDRIWG